MTYEVNLEKYVPQFIQEMGDMEQILESQGNEIERERLAMENTASQMFPDQATWSLTMWEKNYGIEAFSADTDERRNAVIARLVPPETVTPALVQKMADELAGDGIWIEEQPELNHVNIWIIDPDAYSAFWSDVANYTWRTCTQWTWRELQLSLSKKGKGLLEFLNWWELYKPAHIGYTTEYYKVKWKDLLPYTWRDVSERTWLGVLMNMKQTVSTWGDVKDKAGTWQVVNDGYTWRTVKKIKENTNED